MANKTVTVKPSGQGGTYTSLAAAIAGEVSANADLVTMAGILTISIEGDWSGGADTTAANVTGFTTSSSYYVNIVTNAANKAGTSLNTNKYILKADTYATSLNIANSYTRITGLQIQKIKVNEVILIANGAASVVFDSCLIKMTTGQIGIGIGYTASYPSKFINVICLGGGGDYGFKTQGNNGSSYFYNCVAINCTSAFYLTTVRGSTFKNCYAQGSTSGYTTGNAGDSFTSCHSSDGSRSTTTTDCSTSSGAYFTNVTSGSENLAIISSSAFVGAGTDLRADATFAFDYDIVGTTRGASWDVGAFEYVSAGGISIPVVMQHLRMQGAL